MIVQPYKPKVSICIPLRKSQSFVDELLRKLRDMDYDGDMEIVITANWNDSTWSGISDEILEWGGIYSLNFDEVEITDGYFGKNVKRLRQVVGTRLRLVEIEIKKGLNGRDSNIKRNVCAKLATGELFFFTDAKIIRDPDWIDVGVSYYKPGEIEVVGGIMLAHKTSTFWDEFTDNAFPKRNPDAPESGRLITKENFGDREDLPITACLMISHKAYWGMLDPETSVHCGLPEDFADSYEDYSSDWILVTNGFNILLTGAWVVRHIHRQGLWRIRLEYIRSGLGAGQLYATYKDCAYGIRRWNQVRAVTSAFSLSVVTLVGLSVASFFSGLALVFLILALLTGPSMFIMLGFASYTFVRNSEGKRYLSTVVYPVLTTFFIMCFVYGFWYKLIFDKGGRSRSNRWLQMVFFIQRTVRVFIAFIGIGGTR